MTGDTRNRSSVRTITTVRANTATRAATTHHDSDPLVWILVIPLFAACLTVAIAAHRANKAEQRAWEQSRVRVRRQLTPHHLRLRLHEVHR